MGGGDSLFDKIDRGIRGCTVVISCVTPKYALSANCRREVSLADAVKKPIIPLLLDEMTWPPPGPMSMVYTQLLYIDMNGDPNIQEKWMGPKVDELIAQLKLHLHETDDVINMDSKGTDQKEKSSAVSDTPVTTTGQKGKPIPAGNRATVIDQTGKSTSATKEQPAKAKGSGDTTTGDKGGTNRGENVSGAPVGPKGSPTKSATKSTGPAPGRPTSSKKATENKTSGPVGPKGTPTQAATKSTGQTPSEGGRPTSSDKATAHEATQKKMPASDTKVTNPVSSPNKTTSQNEITAKDTKVTSQAAFPNKAAGQRVEPAQIERSAVKANERGQYDEETAPKSKSCEIL
jgi:hypothetical protein